MSTARPPEGARTAARGGEGGSRIPRIASGFRLQWEPAQNAHVLLYPEGMVKLNQSAGEILKRCDGSREVESIVADLEASFQASGLAKEVRAFLDIARAQRWVEWVDGEEAGA